VTAQDSEVRSKRLKIVSIGEILWDVFDDAERLGGAALNFAVHAARLNHNVCFVSAVGDDERGRLAVAKAAETGLETRYIGTVSGRSTGIVTVTVDGAGQPSFVIHRPAAYDYAEISPAAINELSSPQPDLIYFGTLFQMNPQARALTLSILDANPGVRTFYDVNLRRESYTPDLVREFLKRASVVKLNDTEVKAISQMLALPFSDIESFCRKAAALYGWRAVCVTQGADGCSLLVGSEFVHSRGYSVQVADTVGSGDAFAAAFVHGIGNGWEPFKVADFANRVGALVASRPGGTPQWNVEEALRLH